MCGVITVIRKDGKKASKQLLKQYRSQKTRGTDGFGYVALSKGGKVKDYKRFQFEHDMEKSIGREESPILFFHHRYPTSVLNLPETAHPIFVSHAELAFDYYVIHNGWITNTKELRDEHMRIGYRYTTDVQTEYKAKGGKIYLGELDWNDSESLAIELARNIERKTDRVTAKGPVAVLALQVSKAGRAQALYFGTNGANPLTMRETKEAIILSSEDGEDIVDNTMYRMDVGSYAITIDSTVSLMSMETKRAVGFQQHNYWPKEHEARPDKDDYGIGEGYFRSNDYIGMPYDSMSLDEIENLIDDIDADILDAAQFVSEAMDMGNDDDAASWQAEIKTLEEKKHRIENIYVEKAIIAP